MVFVVGLLPALVIPLLLTSLLFLGPLVISGYHWANALSLAKGNDKDWRMEHLQYAYMAVGLLYDSDNAYHAIPVQ
jgi:hypothetical protein